jgi:hypothetical protein
MTLENTWMKLHELVDEMKNLDSKKFYREIMESEKRIASLEIIQRPDLPSSKQTIRDAKAFISDTRVTVAAVNRQAERVKEVLFKNVKTPFVPCFEPFDETE